MLWRLCSEPVDQTVTRRAQAREPNLHIAVIVIVTNVRVIVLIILVKKAGKAKQNKRQESGYAHIDSDAMCTRMHTTTLRQLTYFILTSTMAGSPCCHSPAPRGRRGRAMERLREALRGLNWRANTPWR